MAKAPPDPDLLEDEPGPPVSVGRRAARFLRELAMAVALGAAVLVVVGRLRAPDLPVEAPALTARDLSGGSFDLASLRGQKVVLNFWATWCGPCRVELPTLTDYAQDHPDLPLYFVAVDGRSADLVAFAEAHDMPLGRVLMPEPAALARWQIGTLPTTVVVDAEGRVREAHSGILVKPLLWWMVRGG